MSEEMYIFIYVDGSVNWYNFSGGQFGNRGRDHVIPFDLEFYSTNFVLGKTITNVYRFRFSVRCIAMYSIINLETTLF